MSIPEFGTDEKIGDTYASDEPLWRMNSRRSDSGMDESHPTGRITEEMAGTDPATTAEQALGEGVLS
jgi:hypothetical protein